MNRKMVFRIIALVIAAMVSSGCSEERVLTPNTHDERVPEVLSLAGRIDTSKVKPFDYILRLSWRYDTVRYPVNPNLKQWEVWRVVAKDTLSFPLQLQKIVSKPSFVDSSVSIQPGTSRDSVVVLYRIIPVGNVIDNIQFTGKPSDLLRMIVYRKK